MYMLQALLIYLHKWVNTIANEEGALNGIINIVILYLRSKRGPSNKFRETADTTWQVVDGVSFKTTNVFYTFARYPSQLRPIDHS